MVLAACWAALLAVMFAGSRVERDARGPAARRLIRYLKRARRHERESVFTRADRYLLRLRVGAALERSVIQAGMSAPMSALLLVTTGGMCAFGTIVGVLRGPAAGMLAVAAMALMAYAFLQTARGRRSRRLEAQLPPALDMLVGQLRSHRSIGEAVADVAQWIAEPLGGECSRVAEELRIGVPLPHALERFRGRVPVPAVPAIVAAIVVSDRTGANLAECLARQAAAVRTQVAFRHEVSAMTAHARATGATLAFLPLGVAAAMLLLDPGVFAPMTGTAPGRVLLGAAAAMEFCGWQAIRWMIRRVDP